MRIIVENAVARFPEFRFGKPLSWKMEDGENWAVIGPNGAGKSLFGGFVKRSIALREGSVRYYGKGGEPVENGIGSIEFRDIYSVSGARTMYYQQRWNSRDAEESPYAVSLFSGFGRETIDEYAELFGIGDLLGKRVVSLSSGELRKFLITRALMSEPSVLLIDNPFIGLDENSRRSLDAMLAGLGEKKGLQVILMLSQTKDLPLWIDKVLPVKDRNVLEPVTRDAFFRSGMESMLFPETAGSLSGFCGLPVKKQCGADSGSEAEYTHVLKMKNITVGYGSRKILDGVDWTVKRGERWALLGENGSGKSTLLSLVCGDNPQAYANDIVLFDRRRGTGESIWDIKKRIGYLSTDVHTYYLEDIPCLKVAASGFFDSVGLSRECTGSQYAEALAWMKIFGAEHLAERSFVRISYGEQRLVLLVRAFVKSPELLVLDEPLHGLDTGKKRRAMEIMENYCADPRTTLIYVTHYKDEIPSCITKFKVLTRK